MDTKTAYKIIAKHAFTAAHPYNESKIILIFADSEEGAKAKAVEYFNSRFATVRPLEATESAQIYKI